MGTLIIGRTCADGAKFALRLGSGLALSCLGVRDKKNYGKKVFWFYTPAHLIEGELRAGLGRDSGEVKAAQKRLTYNCISAVYGFSRQKIPHPKTLTFRPNTVIFTRNSHLKSEPNNFHGFL
jgi:hypothetical protein